MYLEPFHKHFPDVAKEETRSMHLLPGNPNGVPADDYAIFESYCTDPTCDCRRVMLNVLPRSGGEGAAISFGFDRDGPMPGPFLDPLNRQGKHAEGLLKLIKELVLSDPHYVARLERHYAMMKQKFHKPRSADPWWKRKRKKPQKRPRPIPGAE